MGSSVELSAVLTPSVIDEINCRQEPTEGLAKGENIFENVPLRLPLTQHLLVTATYSTGGYSNSARNDFLTGTDGPGAGVD